MFSVLSQAPEICSTHGCIASEWPRSKINVIFLTWSVKRAIQALQHQNADEGTSERLAGEEGNLSAAAPE